MPIEGQILSFIRAESVGKLELSEEVFAREPSFDSIKRVVNWQLAKARSGTHKVKTVSEVSGTGRKPRPQKGSGRARQGTLRAPHMRGGAVVHGPLVRSHETSLPKKIRQLGLKSALSIKLREGLIIFIDSMSMDLISTKQCLGSIQSLLKFCNLKQGVSKILACSDEQNENFLLSCRNIANLKYVPQEGLNVYDIVNANVLLISVDGVKRLEKRLIAS